jgi:hypothetical protein
MNLLETAVGTFGIAPSKLIGGKVMFFCHDCDCTHVSIIEGWKCSEANGMTITVGEGDGFILREVPSEDVCWIRCN